jgi:hypothetical protein
MATNLRVGGVHGYQLYREVEPVPAYPRIDPQQPRGENPQQHPKQRADKEELAMRRFKAMRDLIDELKETAGITRVDLSTAEEELNKLGLLIAENELIEQLLDLKIPLEEIDKLFQQIRQHHTVPDMGTGHSFTEADNFFPVFVAGLSEYNLRFQNLQIQLDHRNQQMVDSFEESGRFISDKNRLRLDFQKQDGNLLRLDISVLVAVSEVDEGGRRVILYQRPDQSYALYADKQINLSI